MWKLELDAIDILFMHYITGRTTDDADKYDFWQTRYGRRPEQLLNRLTAAGVIYEDDSLPAVLPKLRVFELKFILKSAGLAVSGNKPELIKRILQYAAVIDFSAVPLKNVYRLSDHYSEFHNQTRFFNFFHFNDSFDVHEVHDFYLGSRDLDGHRIAIRFLEDKVHHHIHDRNKYTAIKAYLLLSHYALEEMGDMHRSMHYLNHFVMLIVLQAMQKNAGVPVSEHFYIDAYTKKRYRAYMESERLDTDGLAHFLADSTGDLPWPHELRREVASLLTDFINRE